jgi:hypothetical protein
VSFYNIIISSIIKYHLPLCTGLGVVSSLDMATVRADGLLETTLLDVTPGWAARDGLREGVLASGNLEVPTEDKESVLFGLISTTRLPRKSSLSV